MLISITGLTACASSSTPQNTSRQNITTIVVELDENYDDVDPFVNEKLFCIPEQKITKQMKSCGVTQGKQVSKKKPFRFPLKI